MLMLFFNLSDLGNFRHGLEVYREIDPVSEWLQENRTAQTDRKLCKKCPTSDQLMLLSAHGGCSALLSVSEDNLL